MPLSDYTDSIGGGLKLKGVKDGGVKKQKKKKHGKVKATERDEVPASDEQTAPKQEDETEEHEERTPKAPADNKYGKTEAQLRHEEKKRQMVRTPMTLFVDHHRQN